VNCANVCHVKTPFSQERFSHERIIEVYKKSAHAPQPGDSAQLKEAKPDCKFCHLNPMYTRVSEERIDYHESLSRCLNCHQEKGVTQAYKHMTHRLRKKTSRSPQEIVELCAKCHQDVELMKELNVSKRGITAVETYKQSIHGKSVTLGSEVAADCISCHASDKLHDIYKKDDRRATVEKKNLRKRLQEDRDALEGVYRDNHSQRICSKIISLIKSSNYHKIHTFIPIKSEVDIHKAIGYCLDNLETFTSITLESGELNHCRLSSMDDLVKGRFGTLYPADCQPYRGDFDLILVPGLAFDSDGYRLGYGGGYYDRLFEQIGQQVLKIAVGFEMQIIEEIPRDLYDYPVDYLITENGILTFKEDD